MPIYEFRCADCGRHFEELLPSSSGDRPACAACGSGDVSRMISLIGGLGGGRSGATVAAGCGCGGNCACGR